MHRWRVLMYVDPYILYVFLSIAHCMFHISIISFPSCFSQCFSHVVWLCLSCACDDEVVSGQVLMPYYLRRPRFTHHTFLFSDTNPPSLVLSLLGGTSQDPWLSVMFSQQRAFRMFLACNGTLGQQAA
ncbi:hypothetical protein M426DRAFT_171606 [Hypoxylon sp. CI-4A]|nr:hypothetical protein M426DRAFT_171606 [Hypoxylon sp. CI-4A]